MPEVLRWNRHQMHLVCPNMMDTQSCEVECGTLIIYIYIHIYILYVLTLEIGIPYFWTT